MNIFHDILEVNGFAIIIDTHEIVPPVMRLYTYEAKVTKIRDRTNNVDVPITSENTCMALGRDEDDAYLKSQDYAKKWAEAQTRQ